MNTNFKNTLNNDSQPSKSWCARRAYKCSICDKEYDLPQDRAQCELKCYEKQEEEKRLAAEKKKVEERNARKKAVDEAFDKAYKLKDEYVKDYGRYRYSYVTDSEDEETYDSWMSPGFINFIRMLP